VPRDEIGPSLSIVENVRFLNSLSVVNNSIVDWMMYAVDPKRKRAMPQKNQPDFREVVRALTPCHDGSENDTLEVEILRLCFIF